MSGEIFKSSQYREWYFKDSGNTWLRPESAEEVLFQNRKLFLTDCR